ncbi:HD domain-containing protein, partial [Candidatus Sumerlaeota bacterium]|nr:HD domain-containing protein [Candidatus Sumerlaeota bacterium]
VAFTGEILNLADVYNLPWNVPYAFDAKYDLFTTYHTQSVLTVPLRDNRDEVIGVLQIINAKDEQNNIAPFRDEDIPIFVHFANNAAVALERAKMTRLTVLRMIKMAEMRDPHETGPHASRVASYAQEIFETWAFNREMPQKEIDTLKDILKVAAILHDVGKIAISDAILKKPGKLDESEFQAMKAHTFLGARLFADSNSELDQAAASVALNHHEKWDGTGYPGHIDLMTGEPLKTLPGPKNGAEGKKGNEIPVFGRIVAIADVYDALSSRRTYKAAWSEEEVLGELNKCSGKHFDPEMVTAFMQSLDEIREVAKRYPY